MDQLKKFTTNELIMLGGAVVVFIFTFFTWFKASAFGFSDSVNGFHYFLQGTIPWLLSIAVAAVLILKKFAPQVKFPEMPLEWNLLYLIATGLAALLILTRVISVDGPSSIVSRGIGIWLCTLGAIAEVVGAFLKYQAKEPDTAAASGGGTPPSSF